LRVLLLEDEPEMAAALRAALRTYDTVIDHVSTLADAEEAAELVVYDAILLDRRVPDGDGLSLIPKLRAKGVGTPVIVLTAEGDLDERIAGLDAGADDYVTKPFHVSELLARLRAVLRRPAGMASDLITVGRLTLDLDSREVRIDGDRLVLPRREFLVLETLLRRIGRTVPRSVLEEAVYGFGDEIQSNALDTHISRVRGKLARTTTGIEIHPVRGIGYLLKQAV
jgi:DNA-binding response OmpR family regulator